MSKVKQMSVEKKDEIEKILINMWTILGMNVPDNYEDIVQYCYEDVCETADPIHWSDGDVAIAFRRWIEDQTNEECTDGLHIPSYTNVQPDTRNKQPLINHVIKQIKNDINGDDVTVLDELLNKLPYEILKNSLPEDQWIKFDEYIWSEIRNDFYLYQYNDIVYIDGFETNDENENGKVIAKVNKQTKKVEYLDERAKTNPYAQKMINEVLL